MHDSASRYLQFFRVPELVSALFRSSYCILGVDYHIPLVWCNSFSIGVLGVLALGLLSKTFWIPTFFLGEEFDLNERSNIPSCVSHMQF